MLLEQPKHRVPAKSGEGGASPKQVLEVFIFLLAPGARAGVDETGSILSSRMDESVAPREAEEARMFRGGSAQEAVGEGPIYMSQSCERQGRR